MSNSSLYGNTGNVTVSANNLITLYNSTPSNVVTANVPGRNFTTLYTQQSDISPTLPYGNSNVEAFLNVGHDGGGNVVQNINMSGNLTVGGQSFLGNVTNVHIDGGTLNFILTTDGAGGLSWTEQSNGNATPFIHFDVTTTANNQQFTDILLANYADPVDFNVMKNGINIEPTLYQKINSTTIQVDILLNNGDTIDVLASGSGSTGPGGNITEVQYNGGVSLSGNSSFTFDQPNSLLSVGNVTTGNIIADTISVSGTSDLGYVSNVTITGGSVNNVLRTDGLGNLTWTSPSAGIAAGSNTQIQFNNGVGFGASANLTFNSVLNLLSANYFEGNGTYLTSLTGANVTGTVANATYAVTAGTATTATSADTAGYAVTAGAAANATVAYGLNAILSNVIIPGGSGGQFLSTDGLSTLSWASVTATPGGSNTYIQFNDNGSLSGVSSFTFDKVANTLTIPSISGLNSGTENVTLVSGVSGTYSFSTLTNSPSIVTVTNTATTNFVIDFTSLSMTTGTSRTFTFINRNTSTFYYCTAVQINSSTVGVTTNWQGGSAPIGGHSNDVYTFNVIKTGASTYSVFASQGQF
jgi:hypothetical protein